MPQTEKRLEPGTLYLLDSDAQYLEEDSRIEEGLRLVPRKLEQKNQEARSGVAIEDVAGH